MERLYYSRDRQRHVEEIEDVVGVLPDDVRGETDELARAFGQPTAEAAVELDIPPDERAAFESAGWVFVAPSHQVARAVDRGESVTGAREVRHVYRDEGGRSMLGTDRMTVRLAPDLSEDQARAVMSERGLEIVNRLGFAPNLYEVRVTGAADPLDLSVDLHQDEAFVYAEPEFLEHIPPRWAPNDPNYAQQWHLNNTGQGGGTAGADISAEAAWDVTRGAAVRLAVIDNGFDYDHPDLVDGVGATSGCFRTTPAGVTFTQNQGVCPDSNHGTFCTGLAGARADNGLGGCGVANSSELVLVACLGDQVGTQATLARAVAYAADPSTEVAAADPTSGAHVISCSLGPNGANWALTAVLQDAIDFAVDSGRGGLGTPIFWAVTNGNFEIQFDEVCAHGNTIAVSRSTRNDQHHNAGWGPELDFVATGVDVFSTQSGGGYGAGTGTSYAAPVAAGVAALLLAVNPTLTWQEVRSRLRAACDQVGGVTYDANGHHDRYGYGRVNAATTVQNETLRKGCLALGGLFGRNRAAP
jgi:subtilisin family serine protease